MDPWVTMAALTLQLAAAPTTRAAPLPGDPGPAPGCPADMRMVEGRHHDQLAQWCVDVRRDGPTDHCYGYHPNLSMQVGPTTEIRVCVDQFEAPNRRGARPLVLQSFRSAEKWCARRGKRLCTEAEWELACEGPEHRPWAYGWEVETRLCNANKGWRSVDFSAFGGDPEAARKESDRLWQGTPSGRYRTCVSPFGIVDMMGNVEEWVRTRAHRRHPGALMGGFWAKPWTGCRGTNDAHQPSFAFYETGFRCCRDVDEEADPGTAD
ncbi:MAG: SUMF1/EgtB/PvdO family nonheme iron enzyme [Myxococcota bacterium]